MRTIKQNILVTGTILIFLGLVLVKNYSPGLFRYDARKMAERSFGGNNIVTPEALTGLKGGSLFLDIDTAVLSPVPTGGTHLRVQPDSVLKRVFLKRILAHKGPVVIATSDLAEAARVWMLLAQTGLKDHYILVHEADAEVLKYKFRPDTLAGPEL